MQDVGPSAHGEEEDEEAAHPHHHGPEHHSPARALPGLLCEDTAFWGATAGTFGPPQPHNGDSKHAVASRIAHVAPIHLQYIHVPPIQSQGNPSTLYTTPVPSMYTWDVYTPIYLQNVPYTPLQTPRMPHMDPIHSQHVLYIPPIQAKGFPKYPLQDTPYTLHTHLGPPICPYTASGGLQWPNTA